MEKYKEVLIADSHDNIEILQAKETQLKNWITDNVYEEVEDSGKKVISVHWVITQKFKDNEMRYKARLAVRGFEEENLKDIRKDSPTCCKDNFCLVTSIIAFNQWKIHSVDVKCVFYKVKESTEMFMCNHSRKQKQQSCGNCKQPFLTL